jgi:hypothetical protein
VKPIVVPTDAEMMRAKQRDSVAAIMRNGRRDPDILAESMFRCQLWQRQREIIRAVVGVPRARVAVKACHASGKTWTAARAALAFFYLFPGCRVITTAPTWTGVKTLLWSEIHQAHGQIVGDMGTTLLDTELSAGPDWLMLGLSTNEGVKFQGHHADHVLVILDEAPGVKPGIWEAIEGIRAGGDVRILAIGNPTMTGNPFHDAFAANRDGWTPMTISAFDTPNLAGLNLVYEYEGRRTVVGDPAGRDLLSLSEEELDANPYSFLTSRRWVKEKFIEWGPGHPLFDSRVLGDFPQQSEDSLLSLKWLQAAADSEEEDMASEDFAAGLDIAGPGEDETVLFIRRGKRIIASHYWSQADPRGEVLAALRPYQGQLKTVNCDSIGIGYYMAQHIADAGYPVSFINVGESPTIETKPGDIEFKNLKAELYWGLRMRFQDGDVSGLTDERTMAQLATIRYEHNARGQVLIESKEDARKRGVKSPDRAEAIMLAFAKPVSIADAWISFYSGENDASKAKKALV